MRPGGTSASESTIDSHSARSVVMLIAHQSGIRRDGRISRRGRRLAHLTDAPAAPADPVEGRRPRHRAAGQRRRGRAGHGLGVQQRDRRHADARRVRGDRRQRGARLPRPLRAARRRRRRPAHARRDRLRHRAHDVRVHPPLRHASTPATSTPGSSSAAARPSPASARSTGCAPSRSPTGARCASPTTPPTSRSATSRCSTASATTPWRSSTRRCASCARRPDRPQLPVVVGHRPVRAADRRADRAGCSGCPASGRGCRASASPTRLAWQANRLDPHQVHAARSRTA